MRSLELESFCIGAGLAASIVLGCAIYKEGKMQDKYLETMENARIIDVNKDGRPDIYFRQMKRAFLNLGNGFAPSTNEWNMVEGGPRQNER